MQRWFAFHRDLGLQLFALYLLLIIPFLITLLIFDRLIGVRIREDVQASDLSLAQSISQQVDLAITKALNTVEGLADYPEVIEADPGGMENVFSGRSGKNESALLRLESGLAMAKIASPVPRTGA